MSRPRYRVNLTDREICLIKALGDRRMSQQEIIARFSFPARTVHHNLVSELVRRETCGDDKAYPPASKAAVDAFLNASDGSYDHHQSVLFWSDWPVYELGSGTFRFNYRYHPVGQGMFCSGRLTRLSGPDFRWVYDCGTDKGFSNPKRRAHVQREIEALKSEWAGTAVPHLDLVTLSHFDTDHLSGLLDLIAEFTIGTLLLPHLTPWDRLVIALVESAAVGDDLLDFLIEPTAFLLERAGEGRIERILLVPGGSEGPALPPLLPPGESPPDGGERDHIPDIIVKDEDPPREDIQDGAGADNGLSSSRVRILRRGGAITIDRAWEFVPYNDARLEWTADDSFKQKAEPLVACLNRSAPENDRKDALNGLKALYADTFKAPGARTSTPAQRNEISLFLYSGPIGRVELLGVAETIPRHRVSSMQVQSSYPSDPSDRFAQMFTGDGYLKTDRQWSEFRTFFRAHDRLRRAGIFQVMHHGSKANWRPEIAPTIEPVVSVFCSDPAHALGHPDWEVLDAFRDYNPKQVDLFHGWTLTGAYRFR